MFSSIATFAVFLAIVNLVVNVSVLTVTVRSRRLREDIVTRIISSLAVSDLCFSTLIPFVCAVLAFIQTNPVPDGLAGVIGTCYQVFGVCSLFHLSFVAIVKCCVIAKPLVYQALFTDRVIAATLLGIWLVSIVLGAMPAFVGARFHIDPDVGLPSSMTFTVLQSTIMATTFVLSAGIIIVLYAKVFLVVRHQLRAILAVVPSGWVAGKPTTAGRTGSGRGVVSTSEVVPVIGVALTVRPVPVDATVPSEALVAGKRTVFVAGADFATKTVPGRVYTAGGSGTSPLGEISLKVDSDFVSEDVGTNISEETKANAITEDEKELSGHISGRIVTKTVERTGNTLEVIPGAKCNNEAVKLVKGEQSSEEFDQRIAVDLASSEVAPVRANTVQKVPEDLVSAKANATQATPEQRTSVKTTVNSVLFAPRKTADSTGQKSALGQSIRSAKNLFIISGVYMITYIPALMAIMKFGDIPPELRHPLKVGGKWLHVSASTFNGLLYIVLHRSVRAELLRMFCRRPTSMASKLGTLSGTTKG